MTERLETRLREHLAALDQVNVMDADRLSVASRRAETRLRRRRSTSVAVASMLIVTIGVVAVWAAQPESSEVATVTDDLSEAATSPSVEPAPVTTATTEPAPPPPAAWTPIAPDPRGATFSPSVVWTGEEALVVGGVAPDGQPRQEAAAYDPDADSWRMLARPPATSGRVDPLVVWTGTEMLVIGGDNPDGSLLVSYGHAYDPSTDSWRVTASPTVGFVTARSPSVWTGSELLVWPSDGGGTSMPITPIAYDPAGDTWRELPEPPIERRQQAASVWTGTEWIVWGGTTGSGDLADGAAYDPRSAQWRVLPESPLSPRRVGGAWTGAEMIVATGGSGGIREGGGTCCNGEFALTDGAAYDPAANEWRSIAHGPAHPGHVPVWIGSQLLMFAKGGVTVYDATTNGWFDPPNNETGAGIGAVPVWTGSVALLIGSSDADVGGARFTPSAGG